MEKNDTGNGQIKKIAIVGPECTGKSWLSEKLSRHYQTIWVPEIAREYLHGIDRPYVKQDLSEIAKLQVQAEDSLLPDARRILFCDTNLLVIKIWSEHKYGSCDKWILDEIKQRKYHLHLLTHIDIPWLEDPLREHPHMRKYFYDVYLNELKSSGVDFAEISGLNNERLLSAIKIINDSF